MERKGCVYCIVHVLQHHLVIVHVIYIPREGIKQSFCYPREGGKAIILYVCWHEISDFAEFPHLMDA